MAILDSYTIDDLNRKNSGHDLYHGNLGYALSFFMLYSITKDEIYRKKALKLIDQILEEFEPVDHSISRGLCGLGWLIDFFIRKRFVPAEHYSEVLDDIDDELYKYLLYNKIKDPSLAHGLIGVTLYLSRRLVNNYTLIPRYREQCLNELLSIVLGDMCSTLSNTSIAEGSLSLGDYKVLKKTLSFLADFPFRIDGVEGVTRLLDKNVGSNSFAFKSVDKIESKTFDILIMLDQHCPIELKDWKEAWEL